MRRVLGLVSFLVLAGGGQQAGATSVVQECSEGIFLASAAVVVGSTIYDVASAPASARTYNQKHFSIRPRLDPVHGSYGFSASFSFGRLSHLAFRPSDPTPKSPSTAFWLSFTSTAAPMLAGVAANAAANGESSAGAVLFLSGLVIGPSVGHLYAGRVGRALGPVALRAAVSVVGLYALAPCFDD